MAVTLLTVIQDNKVISGSDLLCVHSPLIFIIDAEYTGTAPDAIYVKVQDVPAYTLLGTYKLIPYLDTSSTHRQFIFIADAIIRGLMEDFPDFVQSGQSLVPVADIIKKFSLVFIDTLEAVMGLEVIFMALCATRQFGDNPNAIEIFNNDVDTYHGAVNKPVYVYFYNDLATNVITVEDHISSAEMTGDFTRNNCPVGQVGTTVTFTVTYTSYISKADLDAQIANFNVDGQAYANLNGSCALSIFNYTFANLDNLDIDLFGTGAACISESNHLKASWPSGGGSAKHIDVVPLSGGSPILVGPGSYKMYVNTLSIVGETGGGHLFARILTDGTPIPNEWLEGEGEHEFTFTIDGTTAIVQLLFSSGSEPTVDYECIIDDWKLYEL